MASKMEELQGIDVSDPRYFGDEYWTSPINYTDEVHHDFPDNIEIYDVTLRDGEQSPGVCFNEDERVRIAEQLEEMGLKRIEIGMPVTSASIGRAVKKLHDRGTKLELVALCRANIDDINLAIDMGCKSVIVEHSINPYLCKYALGLEFEKLMDRLITSTKYAKEKGLHTNFFGWDALRTNIPYIKKVFSRIVEECHPDAVTVTDTVGAALPETARYVVKELRSAVGDTPVHWHGHNEFGLGTAAAIAALQGGASCLHTAMNGLGERTGNAPTEEVVMALELLCNVKTGVDLSKIGPTSLLIEQVSKQVIGANKAIIGSNLSVQDSGLPADIYLKMEKVGVTTGMRSFSPALIGNPPMEFILSKGAGKANIVYRMNKMGIDPSGITKEQMGDIVDAVKEESRIRKGVVDDSTLLCILRKHYKEDL